MHDAVTVTMSAPPDVVWGLVSDITNTGKFSPETFEAEWLDGATSPAVGVRFRGHVRRNGRGPVYWTTCTIVACDPGREFGFTVGAGRQVVNTWRYRFEPNGEGTDVTESFELADNPLTRLYWKIAGAARGRTNANGMRATLERIKAVVESGSGSGGPSGA
ncbi:MAG: SRPBCC family protein [Acidimicrobiales bacterium]